MRATAPGMVPGQRPRGGLCARVGIARDLAQVALAARPVDVRPRRRGGAPGMSARCPPTSRSTSSGLAARTCAAGNSRSPSTASDARRSRPTEAIADRPLPSYPTKLVGATGCCATRSAWLPAPGVAPVALACERCRRGAATHSSPGSAARRAPPPPAARGRRCRRRRPGTPGPRSTRTRKSRLVVMPCSSARAGRRPAAGRRRPGWARGPRPSRPSGRSGWRSRRRLHAGVHPHVPRDPEARQRAGHGQEIAGRVLGVEPRLHRVALSSAQRLRGQRPPSATPAAARTRSRPRDQLGDRVLHLQTGVHLEEEELARPRRAGTPRCPLRRSPSAWPAATAATLIALAQALVDGGGGRLLDHLLVAALHRAVALAQVDHRAVRVAHDLDLHVARAVSTKRSRKQRVVAEGPRRLAARRPHRAVQVARRLAPRACPCLRRRPRP